MKTNKADIDADIDIKFEDFLLAIFGKQQLTKEELFGGDNPLRNKMDKDKVQLLRQIHHRYKQYKRWYLMGKKEIIPDLVYVCKKCGSISCDHTGKKVKYLPLREFQKGVDLHESLISWLEKLPADDQPKKFIQALKEKSAQFDLAATVQVFVTIAAKKIQRTSP